MSIFKKKVTYIFIQSGEPDVKIEAKSDEEAVKKFKASGKCHGDFDFYTM